MRLETRLEKLEKAVPAPFEPLAIFRAIVDAVGGRAIPMQTMGWKYEEGGEVVRVTRNAGETDDELQARAKEAAFQASPDKSVVRLTAIVNETDLIEKEI